MRRHAVACLVVVLVGVAGCVRHPSITDIGGVRIQPDKGRAVRQPGGAVFYVALKNTGKFPDAVTGATTSVARRAQLVGPAGTPVDRLEVPGEGGLALLPGGYHVVLADLTRELAAGEVIVVTLLFEKSGGIGVVTVVE